MYKQLIVLGILFLGCLTTTSADIEYYAKFADHTSCIDSSDNEYHGNYYFTSYDSGVRNGAVVFDASDESYIYISGCDELSFTNGVNDLPFTVAFWVKIPDPSEPSPILTKGLNPSSTEYTITTIGDVPHGSITLRDSDTSQELICQSVDCLCEYNLTNGWMHVVITYDGSSSQLGLNMYFNGLEIDVIRSGHPSYTCMRDDGQGMYLGRERLDGINTFTTGRLDELIIYDLELSATQAKYLYDSYDFDKYTITLMDKDLISVNKNVSIYENDEYVKTVVYGEPFNVSNVFEYEFVLHEDNFDRLSHIENIADTTTNGISYLVYAFVAIGVIALLGFMYRRF